MLAGAVVDGSWWAAVLPVDPPAMSAPAWFVIVTVMLFALVAVLSYRPVRNLISSHQAMNASFDKLHLVNTYGAFGHVTRARSEIVIEGTDDPHGETGWREYEFKGKPGNPARRPRQFAPYHLRLDWLMWFAAISSTYARGWLPVLLDHLLAGDRSTLKLLRSNPSRTNRRSGSAPCATTTASPRAPNIAPPATGGCVAPDSPTSPRAGDPSEPPAGGDARAGHWARCASPKVRCARCFAGHCATTGV